MINCVVALRQREALAREQQRRATKDETDRRAEAAKQVRKEEAQGKARAAAEQRKQVAHRAARRARNRLSRADVDARVFAEEDAKRRAGGLGRASGETAAAWEARIEALDVRVRQLWRDNSARVVGAEPRYVFGLPARLAARPPLFRPHTAQLPTWCTACLGCLVKQLPCSRTTKSRHPEVARVEREVDGGACRRCVRSGAACLVPSAGRFDDTLPRDVAAWRIIGRDDGDAAETARFALPLWWDAAEQERREERRQRKEDEEQGGEGDQETRIPLPTARQSTPESNVSQHGPSHSQT